MDWPEDWRRAVNRKLLWAMIELLWRLAVLWVWGGGFSWEASHSQAPSVYSQGVHFLEKLLQEEEFHLERLVFWRKNLALWVLLVPPHLFPPAIVIHPRAFFFLPCPLLTPVASSFTLWNFQIEHSQNYLLLLNDIQSIWSQTVPRPEFSWVGPGINGMSAVYIRWWQLALVS